ncbi:flagellar filament capping protein FliD [Clostridium swellfunianum]|uniref:flagellar filament capping protein FliD n=1 Tax=Clostridium swellfunianum TaxID=1367462 RepID=UPI00202EAC56|nr:flagellar filament capping protein FliD [Clostridium swellfunianum]MCM0650459.1 flagellar filament capping protein FliD [Clostridium swellfunianum]
MSDTLRILGMASGLDTETMVKQLMKAENMKVDKVKQNRQVIQWQQDLYREIIGDLTTFRSTYFDVLKPETNVLSKNNYSAFDVVSADVPAAGAAVSSIPGSSAAAGVGAATGVYRVEVTNLASAATKVGRPLAENTTKSSTMSSLGLASNTTVNITYNGTTKPVKIETGDTIENVIQKISNATSGNVVAKYSELTRQFTIQTSATGSGNSLNIDSSISALGIYKDSIDMKTTVDTLTKSGSFDISYVDSNGTIATKNISLSAGATINDIVDNINNDTGNMVAASFDPATKTFSLRQKDGKEVRINNVPDFAKSELGLPSYANAGEVKGEDAVLKITPPGSSTAVNVTKSTNNFTLDGISYSLSRANTTTNITVSSNTQKAFDKIKGFIDKYNEIVDKVNKKISEKKQYEYKPLTDEQKKDMEPEDIKKWEERAKEGLLKNDSTLQNMLSAMRSAFFEGVEGAGISLKDLGLNTSSDYTQKGKIVFDMTLGGEQKLKDMLATKGEQVAKLFMQTSTKKPTYSPDLTTAEREARNSDQGIFQRINDILQDNARTTRSNAGKKGFLIEKAGIKGDFSEFNNLLYNQIKDKDKVINELTKKLAGKENRYYSQFAKLEQAMNSLNSQSNWLAQQLGGGA